MSEEGIVATWLAKCYGCDAAETVKTVPEAARSPNTPLKWGVNERPEGVTGMASTRNTSRPPPLGLDLHCLSVRGRNR